MGKQPYPVKNMFKNNRLIQAINKHDVFSPYIFFPAILVIYFFLSIFDFGRIEYFEAHENILWPILVGLAAYYLAVYAVQKLGWTFPAFGLSFLKGKTIYFLYLLGIIGLVSYIIMLATGQIGITDESVRRNLDPKLNFLSSFLWFAVIFLICYRVIKEKELTSKRKVFYLILLAFVFVAFILMGYRTPIAVMFFTSLIVFHYIVKRIKTSWLILFMIVIGVTFSLFGLFRIVTEDTTQKFNSREGPKVEQPREEEEVSKDLELIREINSTPKWVRALTSEMVTGRIVVSKIMDHTGDNGYMYGSLHAGIFSTVLPGEQTSPRMTITEVVNERTVDEGKYVTRPGRTTTPTLVGQFFIEGGYIAVALGFALYGAVLAMIYNQMQRTGVKSYQSLAYGFVLTIFVISIHTGLLDLVFLLMIAYAIASTSIEQDREKLKA
ncbi:oligosaccharide repeat unit polymerase [Metabacillus iocasae]|uniref:Uncharacterized membrane protein YidH (DUF202 family) n=1 Tax=Priestia iocasae TaxID=2291674 RepID=A0ABS2QX09_9BACI|nr:uncharacterized membrane protein YidH (DUF202 family) [Metabacillus iocasae]